MIYNLNFLKKDSESIAEASYNTDTKELFVTFTSGLNSYTSYNVPMEIVSAFEKSKSPGRFYQTNIKKQYNPYG